MKQYFITDQGKVREHNEDAGGIFRNAENQVLSVVADGMGGHKAGDVASQMVIHHFQQEWPKTTSLTTKEETEEWLTNSIKDINQKVYDHAQENKECAGMGTTVVAAIFSCDFVSIAHIGDSRCYLYHDQTLRQVTEDHSLVNELVRSGQISKEDAEFHPRKNVLMRALGTDKNAEPDVRSEEWKEKDRILICSDGLSNKVSDKEFNEYLQKDDSLDQIGKQLVNLANDRGGEDNITITLSEYETVREGDPSC
ncbi:MULTISPECIES: Stp1/IreP family PP2C-type Ser/Thr phosphatase [Paraliobacillus]|uniref:Stp1/IreP family PP2C-type Ser/Thr phosphatase n=1 Tax=Paraliobacillus TaxID=200903 RepID=UPI000DD4DF1D|nr:MULTISPECIES: Stp1/IreP family PP2C-type Ser/Thr phosphatase [Paraliobacillus]